VGSFAHAAITCVYKSVGVPDGGAAIAPGVEIPAPGSARRAGLRGAAAGHAAWLGARFAPLGPVRRRLEREKPYSPEREFGLGDVSAPPSVATVRLLPRLAGPEVPERRLANYRFLLERLGVHVAAPFADAPAGAS